jgi:DNA-binding MarR family transcriptional regulator
LAQIGDERIQLMGLLVRTHRKLSDRMGRELEDSVGIPLIWFDVLIHVGGAPEARLTMSRLSTDVSLTTGGVTRLIDRMVEAGLVARQNCPNDRRSVHVVLTPDGHALLGRAIAAHVESIDRHLIAPLDTEDRAALAGLLTKLLEDC